MNARALVAALLIAPPLIGQEEATAAASEHRPWLVSMASWGKFATLGIAAGFLVLAAGEHSAAEDSYASLLARCQGDPSLCIVAGNGGYLDAASEALYRQTLDGDASARHWLLVSQVALGASALLWIVDLTKGGDDPENIPYVPLRVALGAHEARVALSFRF